MESAVSGIVDRGVTPLMCNESLLGDPHGGKIFICLVTTAV